MLLAAINPAQRNSWPLSSGWGGGNLLLAGRAGLHQRGSPSKSDRVLPHCSHGAQQQDLADAAALGAPPGAPLLPQPRSHSSSGVSLGSAPARRRCDAKFRPAAVPVGFPPLPRAEAAPLVSVPHAGARPERGLAAGPPGSRETVELPIKRQEACCSSCPPARRRLHRVGPSPGKHLQPRRAPEPPQLSPAEAPPASSVRESKENCLLYGIFPPASPRAG